MDNVTDNVTPATDLIASPCIGVCTVDRARNICIGCLRTLPEIGAWRTMTLEQKRAVVTACEQRAKTWERLGKDWKPLENDAEIPGKSGEAKLP